MNGAEGRRVVSGGKAMRGLPGAAGLAVELGESGRVRTFGCRIGGFPWRGWGEEGLLDRDTRQRGGGWPAS